MRRFLSQSVRPKPSSGETDGASKADSGTSADGANSHAGAISVATTEHAGNLPSPGSGVAGDGSVATTDNDEILVAEITVRPPSPPTAAAVAVAGPWDPDSGRGGITGSSRSTATAAAALYPSITDLVTPQMPWPEADASTAAVAPYPSGLLVQPIPRRRLAVPSPRWAGERHGSPATLAPSGDGAVPSPSSPQPMFGRKSRSNPLEDTEDVDERFLLSVARPAHQEAAAGLGVSFHLADASLAAGATATAPSRTLLPQPTQPAPQPVRLAAVPSAPHRGTTGGEEEKREVSADRGSSDNDHGDNGQADGATALARLTGSAREAARTLRELCELSQVPLPLLEYLDNLLAQCEALQRELIQEVSQRPEVVEELFDVNDLLLDAIRRGRIVRERCGGAPMAVPAAPPPALPPAAPSREVSSFGSHATLSSSSMSTLGTEFIKHQSHQSVRPSSAMDAPVEMKEDMDNAAGSAGTQPSLSNDQTTPPIDVDQLVEQKDMFSLICTLRSHDPSKRLEASLALMRFARDAELNASEEAARLRDEIRSSGGMHSLLALFRTPNAGPELRVVVALAVAYLLPSFVGSQTPPGLGLKIMDCLRLLSNARTIEPNGVIITRGESFKAGAKGLFLFWINQVEPLLEVTDAETMDDFLGIHGSSFDTKSSFGAKYIKIRASGGGMYDQRHQSIEMQELLEIMVTLITYIARDDTITTDGEGENLNTWRCTLVEQICAVEAARPIAVREGILGVIVEWVHSKDTEKNRTAASALSHLTSIEDKYMAGWIHSQMVNEGVLQGIVTLFDRMASGMPQDVQLAIARILSSLCVAPHTRAAVVEANGITPLIQFLCEHRDRREGALYAGRALLQLAAGAIVRAEVFGEEDIDVLLFASPDKQDAIVQQIIDSGAINHFVEMALSDGAQLRSVGVEALRVLSEDTSSRRQTRGLLCRIGAARALGVTLKECVKLRGEELLTVRSSESTTAGVDCFRDLHEAVCCLANILDPFPLSSKPTTCGSSDSHDVLIRGCRETAESGGLESLLFIASHSCFSYENNVELSLMNLLVETCRSLASLSPLLLSDDITSVGYSKWADEILTAFYKVIKHVENDDSAAFFVREVQTNVLRGVAALAHSEPLKVRIVDNLLPYLVKVNNIGDGGDIENYVNQIFQSLEFADDDVAVQIAGNSPQLLADLFCFERSLLIQAMARQEIRQVVIQTWVPPCKELNLPSMTYLMREVSDISRSDDCSVGYYIFEHFSNDLETRLLRNSVIRQYRDMYTGIVSNDFIARVVGDRSNEGLLKNQIFPLVSSDVETQWILNHDIALRRTEPDAKQESMLSPHVRVLLDYCFPSQLLQDNIIPMCFLRPQASFNFKALLMPQRRYFSFRREGQLLSRLCARQETLLSRSDIHWTLGFTNSTFSGEFSESLVQALYLCPMIRGLTFARKPDSVYADASLSPESEKESIKEEDGAILAILAGSLPPWISHITFDGLLSDRDLKALVSVLESVGKLSIVRESPSMMQEAQIYTRGQGTFVFMAIRRSPDIRSSSWTTFFNLLGQLNSPLSEPPIQPLLSSLKILDLSGNQLGDELCASVLALAHKDDSGCCLEQLDLSGNRILAGTSVLKVLTKYVEKHRYSQRTGRFISQKAWKSQLHTLYLADNGLHLGKAWLEIISLLQHNALELHDLDLSSNGLVLDDFDIEIVNVLISALAKNSCLSHFNLSGNKFSLGVIDKILKELSSAEYGSVLGFLLLDNNFPELSAQQKSLISSISLKARKALLLRSLNEKEIRNRAENTNVYGRASEESRHDNLFKEIDEADVFIPAAPGPAVTVSDIVAGYNMITVLFSAPLVFTDEANRLRPFAKLDFSLEREHMWQCLKEASRDIELSFDTATHDRFLAAISKRCSCLHYSGHGHPEFLPFEDKGAPQWFSVQKIKDIIKRDEGSSFRFVFVSACYSENAGKTFAEAGVPHVVCCRQESELKDTAALAFTRQFYLSLAIGNTVREAFDLGCNAVRATPNLRDADKEMEKFRLLPENGNHDVPIFNARPVFEWPRGIIDKPTMPGRRRKGLSSGGTRASELSVRNMIQEDPSPSPSHFFLGRELDIYHLLRLVLESRLVSVIGETGIGRSSLVCALCHYINERASTMTEFEQIYFVKTKQSRGTNRTQALIWRLLQKLAEASKLMKLPEEDASVETMSEIICRTLKNEKAMIVFDHVDLLEDTDEVSEFPMFLSDLLRETRHVRVLLTNRHSLGIPSLGERSIRLGPLTFLNSVTLFANLCPHLHTPKARRTLRQRLVLDPAEEELLPTDPGLSEPILKVFELVGGGVPARIEKAAYNISKEDYLNLLNGHVRVDQVRS